MPHVVRVDGTKGNPIYQVGGKSFVFFRNATQRMRRSPTSS